MTCEKMWQNGRVVDYADARIHAFSGVVKYGAAVFEGIRGYWSAKDQELYVFRLREHMERLAFGMKAMRFEGGPSVDELVAGIIELARANELRENVHFRAIVYLDGDGDMNIAGPVGVVMGAVKRPPSKRLETGINVCISSWQRIADNALPPRVKCVANYVNNRAAEMEAAAGGYDGALMLTADGKLSEATGACVFLVRGGRLVTPDTSSDILESITRETVIRLAREKLGLAVEERRVDRSELAAAEEAFWCGSGQEVVPIVSVIRQKVGTGTPGPVTRQVQQAYFDVVEGRVADHPEWRQPVWQAP